MFNEGQNILLPFSVPSLDFNGINQKSISETAQPLGDLQNNFTVAGVVKTRKADGIQNVLTSKSNTNGWASPCLVPGFDSLPTAISSTIFLVRSLLTSDTCRGVHEVG